MAQIHGVIVEDDNKQGYIFFVHQTKEKINLLGVYVIRGEEDKKLIGEYCDLEGIAATTDTPLNEKIHVKLTQNLSPGRYLLLLQKNALRLPNVLYDCNYIGKIIQVSLAGKTYAKIRGLYMPREVPDDQTYLYHSVEKIVDDSKPV